MQTTGSAQGSGLAQAMGSAEARKGAGFQPGRGRRIVRRYSDGCRAMARKPLSGESLGATDGAIVTSLWGGGIDSVDVGLRSFGRWPNTA